MAETTKKAQVKATTTKTSTAKKSTSSKTTAAKKAAAPKAEKAVTKSSKKAAPSVNLNRLDAKYRETVRPSLVEKFHYRSVMEAPRLEKIVINIGVGDATQNAKALEDSVADLTLISGQHPVVTKAKKSIASFKLRAGQAIGCKVTLRGKRMYEFLDKLISITLPRVRDFRGVSRNAFDGHGNYTLGVKEQLIFPEIDYDKTGKLRGMDIVMVTTAKNDEEAFALLEGLGMPFRH